MHSVKRPAKWSKIVDLLVAREQRDEAATVIDTHLSTILLVGAHAYKFKRPVVLPFADLRTVAARLECCERELVLNQRTAPELYLKVRRFTRGIGINIEMDGDGDVIDCCVEMRRFDQAALLSTLPLSKLTRPLIDGLVQQIVRLHKRVDASMEPDGAMRLWKVIESVSAGLAASGFFASEAVELLRERFETEWMRHRDLLDERAARGKVRHGHGDLHLANICLYEGRPLLFDCLEFDEELATVDVLYDLAFLLMDLWRRGAVEAANRLLNRYVDGIDETDGLAALPLFMALRAAIRAQVLAIQFEEETVKSGDLALRAHEYLTLASRLMQPNTPRLIAIGGLSGSGKSTLAESLAPKIGAPPGARILSSDRIRKDMFLVQPEHRLPPSAYASEVSQAVYGRLMGKAAATLDAGWSAIGDAVFDRAEDQAAMAAIARQLGVPFTGIWLDAPTETLMKRVAARQNDVSDATVSVVLAQANAVRPQNLWHRLLSEDSGDLLAAAFRLIGPT